MKNLRTDKFGKEELANYLAERFLFICKMYGIDQYKLDNGRFKKPHPLIQGYWQEVQQFKDNGPTATVHNFENPGIELLVLEDGEIEVRDIYPQKGKTRILYEGLDINFAMELVLGLREVKKAVKII